MQLFLTPAVHVRAVAHGAQGDFPVVDHAIDHASHAMWHTVSEVEVHDFSTPIAQVESAAQGSHGALPVAENELPPMQGAIAPLHTMSAPGTQTFLTLAAPHVEVAAQGLQGAFPVDDHVVPATHGVSHTVFAVLVQEVLTPVGHMTSALHGKHGALPDEE